MKYRKPITSMKDRHVLIELDGGFTDNEIGHMLRKAYLNHKAPHEYDDVKKYIRDLTIGKHNSVYIMSNGIPAPLAAASIFYPNQLTNGNVKYDNVEALVTGCGQLLEPGYVNNSNCTGVSYQTYSASNASGNFYIVVEGMNLSSIPTYGYNNGIAIPWELLYTNNTFTSFSVNLDRAPSGTLVVGPLSASPFPYAGVKYAYALYQTSNNPLTLTTYYYWSPSTESFTYVYFVLYANASYTIVNIAVNTYCTPSGGNQAYLVPLFYSQGNYSFNSGSYYISMWQFTYT
jgi:hypothetical protein